MDIPWTSPASPDAAATAPARRPPTRRRPTGLARRVPTDDTGPDREVVWERAAAAVTLVGPRVSAATGVDSPGWEVTADTGHLQRLYDVAGTCRRAADRSGGTDGSDGDVLDMGTLDLATGLCGVLQGLKCIVEGRPGVLAHTDEAVVHLLRTAAVSLGSPRDQLVARLMADGAGPATARAVAEATMAPP